MGAKEAEMRADDRAEIQAIRDELAGLRAQVDTAHSGGRPSWWTRVMARPRVAKRLTRVGIVTLMLALPVMVSASHQFTDVPTSSTFHAAISKLYGARLTTGCTATKFCPNANVTRGQMAAFLVRGLGRGEGGGAGTGLADDWATFDNNLLAGVDLVHGGGAGGTGHVLVTASASAYTTLAGTCPCEFAIWLINEDTGEESAGSFTVISDVPTPPDSELTTWYEGTASVSYLFTVQSGVTNSYLLGGSINPTTPPTGGVAGAEWNISAVYIPFGGDGGNPTLTGTQAVDGRRGH
jgi:hypothetical protein